MVAWRDYAAAYQAEREWIHRVGLEVFVNLPWGSTPIRTDVIENFLNTAQSVPHSSIFGHAYGKVYVITAEDITAILHLPIGTTTTINDNPNPATYDYWANGAGSLLSHRIETDGWSVSQGPAELRPRKYGILQGLYFKRKQTYTSHQCLLQLLTVDDLSTNGTETWN